MSSRGWSTGVGAREEVAALELNVSCPNVESGLIVGESPEETAVAARGAAPADREAADREADPERPPGPDRRRGRGGRGRRRLADQHAAGRGDRSRHREPWLGAERGGLSGPAVRAVALEQVARSPRRSRSRWSGWAGSQRPRTPLDLISAGATVVAVGTESFRDPAAGARIAAELQAELQAGPLQTDYFFSQSPETCFRTAEAGIYCRPMQAPVQSSNAAPERSLDQRMEALKGPTTSARSGPS